MAKVVIFGVKDFASLAHYYLRRDSDHEVAAFTVHRTFMPAEDQFEGLPVVPFEDLPARFPPAEFSAFAPLSHKGMNSARESVYREFNDRGYSLISYVSSRATCLNDGAIGDNCFILEDNTIQPFVTIGNNVVLWSGNHIGHHSQIKDHVFVTSHVVLSGHCVVDSHCFLGVNATIRDQVHLGQGTLVGMGANITRSTEPWSLYKADGSKAAKVSSKDIDFQPASSAARLWETSKSGTTTMSLTTAKLAAYKEQGFVHLPARLDPVAIREVLWEARQVFLEQLIARRILRSSDATESEIDDGMALLFRDHLPVFMNCGKQAQHLISLHRLALDERLIDLVRQVGVAWPNICTRPVLYFNSPRLAKSEVYWRVFAHQDWRSMQGSLDSVVIWAPLVDLPSDLGPLEVLPKSHLDGLVTGDVENGFGKVPDAYLQNKEFVSLPCAVGDVVVFSSFLVHRSGTNSSPQIRWSCHFRYNNLAEATFVDRGYPHPYLYKPTDELLTTGFPQQPQVRDVFRPAA